MNPFTRQLRKLTIASHFLLIIFLGIFLIYTENFTYIYEVGRLKNTATIVLNFIFATLLSIHYILILINLVDSARILHIGTDKPLRTILWGSYPLILVLWLSGFNLGLFYQRLHGAYTDVYSSIVNHLKIKIYLTIRLGVLIIKKLIAALLLISCLFTFPRNIDAKDVANNRGNVSQNWLTKSPFKIR